MPFYTSASLDDKLVPQAGQVHLSDQPDSSGQVERVTADPIAGVTGLGGLPATLASAAQAVSKVDPFEAYTPGTTSPFYQAPQGFISNFLDVMSQGGLGTMRMRLAQQESTREQERHQMAVQNFHQNQQVHQENMRLHNLDALQQGWTAMPFAKDLIRSAPTPEVRSNLVNHFKKLFNGFAPGVGDMVEYYSANQSAVEANDILLADKGQVGQNARMMVKQMGYEKWIQTPEARASGEILTRDTVADVMLKLPVDIATKMASSTGISENEFRNAYNDVVQDPQQGMSIQRMIHAKGALDSVMGQEMMANSGVHLGKASLKQQMLRPSGSGNPMNQAKFEELQRVEAKLKHAEATPDAYTEDEINTLNTRRDVLLRVQSPAGSPSQNPGGIAGLTLSNLSGGKYQTDEDMLHKTKPGTPERLQGLAWSKQATQVQKEASAQAQLTRQMSTPVDMSKVDMYSRKDIRAGILRKKSVSMSEYEKRTNTDNIELDPKFVASMSKLSVAKKQGNEEMFDLAAKSFIAKDTVGLGVQWTKWKALDVGGLAAAQVASDPANRDLVTYHDTYTAWAGKDARALGDEVGTMTDADRLVWKDTFPKPTDPPAIQKAKRGIFNRMVDVIYEINSAVAVGEEPSKALLDRKHGIFGQAQDTLSKARPDMSSQTTPKKDTRSRSERLAEEMRKGQ